MKTVNLIVNNESRTYSQSGQTSDINFMFLKRTEGGFEELYKRMRCRDYFGEMVVASHWNIAQYETYSFSMLNDKASIEETLLSLTLGHDCFYNIYKKLNKIRLILDFF